MISLCWLEVTSLQGRIVGGSGTISIIHTNQDYDLRASVPSEVLLSVLLNQIGADV
jgi:hypothetical protein